MPTYELYDHAGEIPFANWLIMGVTVPILDKDGTITSFQDDEILPHVRQGLINNRLSYIYPDVALVSNSGDSGHIKEVAEEFGSSLGVRVFPVCVGDGHSRKPNPDMGEIVAAEFDISTIELGVIGDRRMIDVKFGHALGARAVALCKKVGKGDASGVPPLRVAEFIWVGAERVLGIAKHKS